jgi:hypothetical protein
MECSSTAHNQVDVNDSAADFLRSWQQNLKEERLCRKADCQESSGLNYYCNERELKHSAPVVQLLNEQAFCAPCKIFSTDIFRILANNWISGYRFVIENRMNREACSTYPVVYFDKPDDGEMDSTNNVA